MTTHKQANPGNLYGVREFDLSQARDSPGELVQLPNTRRITTLSVPDEAYIRLGSQTAPKLDLRDEFNTIKLPEGFAIGQIYLQNPAGSGTLKIANGITAEIDPEITIDTLETISGTVTVADDGSFVLDAANQGTLPVEQQTAVDVTASAASGLAVEQQTPVGVEDSAGAQVDPRQQEGYATAYTSVDLNTTGTTALYAPTNDATVTGVHIAHGGSTAEMRLEVTDGTNTAVLEDAAAGSPIHFSGDLRLAGGTDSLQIVVEAAEGSALSETAAVSRGEL